MQNSWWLFETEADTSRFDLEGSLLVKWWKRSDRLVFFIFFFAVFVDTKPLR